MSALGLKIIDESVQAANIWINDVDMEMGWTHKQRSYRLLRAMLHALRDHLSVDEAAQLGAQLPTLIRGVYYEGWNPSKTPIIERARAGLEARVQADFHGDPLEDVAEAIAAVFSVLRAHVSAGEIAHVEQSFTREVRALF